jgi:hypothetical protein
MCVSQQAAAQLARASLRARRIEQDGLASFGSAFLPRDLFHSLLSASLALAFVLLGLERSQRPED